MSADNEITFDPVPELTTYTDLRVERITEIADFGERNEEWTAGRGMTWAKITGCLIFAHESKCRTELTREEVRKLMDESTDGWITVPFTQRHRVPG